MDNAQLPATYVADTGTGRLYSAYAQGPDEAAWDFQDTGIVSKYRIVRTRPIATLNFAGVDRLSAKLTETLSAGGISRIGVIEVVTSMPVSLSQAERDTMFMAAYWHLITTLHTPIITGRLPT